MAQVGNINRARRPATDAGVRRRKKRRKRNPALGFMIFILLLLAAGVVLSLTVFFRISSVTAVGVDKYMPDEIVAESGIQIGENIFRIDTKAVTGRILDKFPYVESVTVRHKFPHSVQLELTQCAPAGAIIDGDDYLIITRDGKVLERGIVFIPDDVPVIKGIKTGGAKPGSVLGPEAADALRVLDYLFNALTETKFGEITNVDLTDLYNMKVVYENRLLLNLGTESDLPAKLNFLKEAIANEIPDNAQGRVDASDINRSLNYMPMSIEDAIAGKKRGSAEYAGGETQDAGLDTEEPEDAESDAESEQSSE